MAYTYILFEQVSGSPEKVYAVYTSEERADAALRKIIDAHAADRHCKSCAVKNIVVLSKGGPVRRAELETHDGHRFAIEYRVEKFELNLDYL